MGDEVGRSTRGVRDRKTSRCVASMRVRKPCCGICPFPCLSAIRVEEVREILWMVLMGLGFWDGSDGCPVLSGGDAGGVGKVEDRQCCMDGSTSNGLGAGGVAIRFGVLKMLQTRKSTIVSLGFSFVGSR